MTSRVFNSVSMAVAMIAAFGLQPANASTWTGGTNTGSWSDAGSPGWNGTGIPNGTGAIAIFDGTAAGTTDQNTGSNVTVGTISLIGSTTGTRTISPTNGITLNQDGAGSGFATISNSNTNVGTRLSLSATGNVTLADDLLISNTSASTGSFSIGITSVVNGTGNITISNIGNSITAGVINFGASNTFSGTVLVQKGAVSLSNTGFGGSGNAVTLGSSGNGSATLVTSGSAINMANNITVASGSGGTLLLGSSSAAATNSTFSGTLALNGNLSVTSSKTSTAVVRFSIVISGAGSLRTEGTGAISLRGINTYTGSTVLNGGQFTLADNAGMKFVIGANGVNNSVSGTANQTAIFDGDFTFDLTGAASSGSWTIVNASTLAETFSSTFQVNGFSQASDIWTLVSGGTTYTFTEATGILTAVPEPTTWALLAGGLVMLVGLKARRRRNE